MSYAVTIGLVAAGSIVALAAFRVVARHHSTACPHWLTAVLENPYFNRVAGSALILERANIRPGMHVLDVGCGPGRLTVPTAERVGPAGSVMALDLQPGMIRKLRAKLTDAGLTNVEPVIGGAGEGYVPKNTFDRALLVTVLGEIVDQGEALAEIRDALKPGGLLSVTEALPDPHYQTRRRVRRLAEAAGFTLHDETGTWYAHTMNFSCLPGRGVGQLR